MRQRTTAERQTKFRLVSDIYGQTVRIGPETFRAKEWKVGGWARTPTSVQGRTASEAKRGIALGSTRQGYVCFSAKTPSMRRRLNRISDAIEPTKVGHPPAPEGTYPSC